MNVLILPPPLKKILVVGPLYDHIEKLPQIKELSIDYDWIILNGNISQSHYDQLKDLDKIIYVAGRHDLLSLIKTENNWIKNLPNAVIANFAYHSVLITDGGIPNNVRSQNDLTNNLEITFLSQIDGKPWHKVYNGRLGYVISNNPLGEKPQYYNYSMQLGTTSESDRVYAQEVDEMGLKQTICL